MNSVTIDFDAWWDYDHPDQTAQRFADLLATLNPTNTNTDNYVCLLTQLARTQSLQQKFVEAHHYLDQANNLLDNTISIAKVRYCLERGRTFNSANEKKQAMPLFQTAYDLALSLKADFYAIDAAHMLGIAAPSMEQQLAWNDKAIALAEISVDPKARQWLGSLYNNTAWTYFDGNEYETALVIFEKALAWRQENQHPLPQIFIARWCVARTLRALQRPSEALIIQQSLCEIMLQTQQIDGYVYEELAECWWAMGKPATARPYFQLAYEHLSKDSYLATNEAERLTALLHRSVETI